jgi:Tfp pilus assembly PilM family ATPase/Tfp pilus assembly protein PilN
MPLFQSSLGIDLRQDRIILSHMRKSLNRVSVAASEVFPLMDEKPKEDKDAEVINTIQRFINSHNVSKENVVLALPREKAFTKLIEIPSAARENLRKVIEYELVKHIPFPPEDAIFDFQVLEESEGFLRVFLVVVRKTDVSEVLELVKRMGIQPTAIEITSTASVNLYYYDQHSGDPVPVALLDIEKHFVEFHFFEKGNLKGTFHVPCVGEADRTKDLPEAYRLALFKGLGPKEGKQSFYAFGEEANEILIERLKQGLTPDITLARSFKKVQMMNGLENLPEVYGAIGLALRGLSKTKWTINLLPENLRKRVSQVGLYLAIIFSMVSLVLLGFWAIRPMLQQRNDLNRIRTELEEKKPKVDSIEAIQKKKGLLEKEVQEFELLTKGEISKLEILKELSDIFPSTVWIWNLKVQMKEVSKELLTDVELNGFANSASDLIAILDKSPLFEKVEFSSPVIKERRGGSDQVEKERFRISAKVERRR